MNYPSVQTIIPMAHLSCQVYYGEISIYCYLIMEQFTKSNKTKFDENTLFRRACFRWNREFT